MKKVCFFAAMLIAVSSAQAAFVTLTNADFELSTQENFPDGFDSPYDVPGWYDLTITDAGIEDAAWWITYDGYSAFMAVGNGAYLLSDYTIQTNDAFSIGFVGKSWDGSSEWTATLFYGTDPTNNIIGSYTQAVDGVWTPYSDSGAILPTPGSVGEKLGISFVNTGSGFANLDNVTIETVTLFFANETPVDGATDVTNLPVISCEIIEADDTLNTNSIVLSLDGSPVTHSLSQAGATSTVSYAVSTELDPGVTYEAQVVCSGTSSGPYTNTWSFTTDNPGAIDVVISGTSESGDQALIDFLTSNFVNVAVTYGDFSNFDTHSNTIASAHVFMVGRKFSSAAYANAANSAKFNALTNAVVAFSSYVARPDSGRWGWHGGPVAAGDSMAGDETTVTAAGAGLIGVAEGAYDWYALTNNLNAAGTGTVGDGDILATIGSATNILAAAWNAGDLSDGGATFGGDRLLFNLHDDGSNTVMPEGDGADALVELLAAYTPLVPIGTETRPDITSFAVSAGTATLTWNSDTLGTYSILSSPSLTSPVWSTNKTGIAGGETNTTDSVPVSGGTVEFYKIVGE